MEIMENKDTKTGRISAIIIFVASTLTAIVSHQGIHDGVFLCSVIAALTTGIGLLIYLFQKIQNKF
jgi:hypothetical protein